MKDKAAEGAELKERALQVAGLVMHYCTGLTKLMKIICTVGQHINYFEHQ